MNEYFRRPFNRAVDYAIDRGLRSYLRDPVGFTDRINRVDRYFRRSGHIRKHTADKLAVKGAINAIKYSGLRKKNNDVNLVPEMTKTTSQSRGRSRTRRSTSVPPTPRRGGQLRSVSMQPAGSGAVSRSSSGMSSVRRALSIGSSRMTSLSRGHPDNAYGQQSGTVSFSRIRTQKKRKIRKGSKKKSKNYYAGNCYTGAVIKTEKNYTTAPTDGQQAFYINVGPPNLHIRKVMVYSLMKKVFSELFDCKIEDYLDAIPTNPFFPAAAASVANFGISYTPNGGSIGTLAYVEVNFTIGITTWEQLGDLFRVALDNAVYGNPERMDMISAYIQPNGGATSFPQKFYNFKSCMFRGYYNMRFSVQNATAESATGSLINDTVLVNPIEYSVFKGKGNGPLIKLPKRGLYDTLVADDAIFVGTHNPHQNTLPGPNPPAQTGVPQDILADGCTAKDFKNAKKAGKGIISPGAIKDFQWKEQINSSFMLLYSKLCGRNNINKEYCTFGSYVMVCFDKIVTKITDVNLSLKYEVTADTGGVVSSRQQFICNPLVQAS